MARIREILDRALASATMALGLLASISLAQASSFKVLYTFAGKTDGGYPAYGSPILDGQGNLYGTTALLNSYTAGTVYKLAPNGTETVLWTFAEGSAGYGPEALTMDEKSNLYGVACCGGTTGGGIVFKVTPDGHESVLHYFGQSRNDGAKPYSALASYETGKFFGTTVDGGKHGEGTVYAIATNGRESPIHSFKQGGKGFIPFAGVIIDGSGNLYGTTDYGGTNASEGTVFKLALDGRETILYSFKGPPNDGSLPTAPMIMDAQGNLYGTTHAGGESGCESNTGCGVVFKFAADNTETILRFFKGGKNDGSNPVAGLIVDNVGNLYGTTEFGGSKAACNGAIGCGTVFEIAPDGTEIILHKFTGSTDGANPVAGLVADSSGNFYGAAMFGGKYGYGTVFEITP